MPNYIKSSQFAKKHDLTRQGISFAIKNGLIPENATKKEGRYVLIDQDNIDVKSYIESIHRRDNGTKKKKKTVPRQTSSKKKTAKTKVSQSTDNPEPSELGDVPDYILKMLDEGRLDYKTILSMPKVWVEKLQKYESLNQTKIKTDEIKRKLVSRELVEKFLDKMRVIDKNYIMTLEDRISNDLASIFSCTDPTKIQEARLRIKKESKKIINYMAKEQIKFITMIGEELE